MSEPLLGVSIVVVNYSNERPLARCVGVSCDDQATSANVASGKRVEAIEASFGPNRRDLLVDLKRAAERDAIVIAWEVLPRDRQNAPAGSYT
jgi:hypothetical protein